MSWQPAARLIVAGGNLAGQTLAGVRIYRGRDTVDEQPRASYATVQLLSFDDDPVPAAIGDRLQVSIRDDAEIEIPLFTGDVSDVAAAIDGYGSTGFSTVFTLTAVGPLARLHRARIDPAGFGTANEGERIAQVLANVYTVRWATIAFDLLWTGFGAAETWDEIDQGGDVFPEVDTPGQFEVAALATDDPRQAVYDAASDGRGMLFETGEGLIGYADQLARAAAIANAGYLELPPTAIAAPGLASVSRIGDLANVVEVTYSVGTETATNDASIRRLGENLVASYTTRLTTAADALDRAQVFAATRADPRPALQDVSLDLEALNDTTLRAALIRISPGAPVRITETPTTIAGGSSWQGFVEAIEWELSRVRARLTLTLSDEALSSLT